MDLITQAGFFAAAGASASGEAAEATDDNFQDTVLLLHGDGTDGAGQTSALGDPNYKALRENSASREIIVTGNPYGTDFSPYYHSDGYWSNSFDGSNDYLNIPDHPTLRIGTSDFTIEFWVYLHSKTGYTTFYDKGYTNAGGILLQSNNNSSDVRVFFASGPDFTSSSEIPLHTWTHVALVRTSGTATLYFDGTSVGSASSTDDLNNTSVVQIGRGSTSYYLDGYISNFRLVIGTAIYTSTFTRPTTPFTDPTTSGELSVYFDGIGDYLTIPASTDFNFSGDFTIEFWLYKTESTTAGQYDGILYRSTDWRFKFQQSDTSIYYDNGTDAQLINYTGSSPMLNCWHHIAFVRSGSTLTGYVDGTSYGSVTESGAFTASADLLIGRNGTDDLGGFISNLRIVNGTALYTGAFTPSSSPLTTTSQGATASEVKLLACQSKIYSDESTSEHPIIVNGNTNVSEFGPFGDGYWSNYFDTSGDYLEFTGIDFTDFNFGTGEFLIEGWINYTSQTLGSANMILGQTGWGNVLQLTASGYLTFYQASSSGSSGTFWITGTSALPIGSWTHFAIQRDSSGNLDLWINGTREATTTSYSATTMQFHSSKGNIVIHHWNGTTTNNAEYISNFRIKNSAVYTSGASITVPTTPFTSDANTKLLTCQSNRFIDNSSLEHSVTVNGNSSINELIPFEYLKRQTKLITCQGNRFKDIIPERWAFTIGDHPIVSTNIPFTTTKANNVGSVYLSATTDDLEIKVSDLPTGASARCMEFWVYLPEQTYRADTEYLVQYGAQSTNQVFSAAIVNSSGKPRLRFIGYSSDYTTDDDMNENAWNFVSVVYTGSAVYHYLNGRLVHQSTRTLNTGSHTALWVNAEIGGADTYTVDKFYIADLAVYDIQKRSGNFLPPTTTVANTTNTKVLTAQYSGAVRNLGVLDDSKHNSLVTRVGNTALGSFTPYSAADGYWSYYFDTNHPMEIPDTNNALDLSGDFTVEFWAYEPKIATTNGTANMYFTIDTLDRFQLFNDGTNVRLYINGGNVLNGTASPLNQWNHIALVRSGSGSNNISLYRNGSRLAQGTSTYSIAAGSMMLGGQDRGGTTGYNAFSGYLSNFRILKGTALYSGASITVPTEPLTDITNTSLLTCQSNRIVDNSTNDANITTLYTSATKVVPYSPFTPSRSYSKDLVGGSIYLDGTGDRLEYDPLQFRNIQGGDFTIEVWWYPINTAGSFPAVFSLGTNGSYSNVINIGIHSYPNQQFGIAIVSGLANDFTTSNGSWREFSWNHLVMTREGSTLAFFCNGKRLNSVSNTETLGTGQAIAYLGCQWWSGDRTLGGYYSGFRVVQGEAVYGSSSTLTMPTQPVTDTSNTSILSNFTNVGIFDHTMKNNLETVNNTRIRTDVKQLNTGSIYFDGSSDELNINDTKSDTFYFGTGKFTIEAFIRVESGSSSSGQWFTNEGHGGWAAGGIAIWHFSTISIYFHDYNTGSPLLSHAGSYNDGVMRHYAIVRGDSGACALFVDGTRVSTGTHTGNVGRIGGMCIGAYKGITSRNLKGFIDEMRVTKGVARYDPSESSITVPTESFANR